MNGDTTSIHATIQTRVPGFDPARFWATAPGPEAWQAMVEKYAALAELARLPEDRRGAALRAASRRWPGSLREAELIGPTAVDERQAAAAAGLLEPERSRSSWTHEPALAVVAWATLHRLLADQLRFRAVHRRTIMPRLGTARDSAAFSIWLASEPSTAWATPERIVEVVGPRLRVRSAYLWLAAMAGLELPRLNALLLGRAGHWDRRPDDPRWAHDG